MPLWARSLYFVFLTILVACGMDAQAQMRQVTSNLRRPLEPMSMLGGLQSAEAEELLQMSAQAGVVFAGQVVAVKRPATDAGWVQVEFHVDEAVRGCTAGSTYRLREWAGLWSSGMPRYRVGQQLLMMLHAAGRSGLSSPVGGQDGAIPIVGTGAAPKPSDASVIAGQQAVDLRWIETRLLRAPAQDAQFHTRLVSADPMQSMDEMSSSDLETDANHAPLPDVLAMLRAGYAPQ